jgi:pimeloyl-ACP methyl ester carboxylesterase
MSRGRRSADRLVPVAVPGFAGRVNVRDEGPRDAPALFLLHGFSGSLHWFDLTAPLLIDRFRLVRVDLLGHGGTGGPSADAPLQARVAEAVLDELDITGATAVGHSFGADVAVELAERSDRVQRLVVVAQAPDYSDATLPRGNRLMTVPVLGTALGRTFQAAAMVVGAAAALRRGHAAGTDLARQGLADFRSLHIGMFRVVLDDRRLRMAARPLDLQMQDSGKPALVILGEDDHFYGARSAGRYRAAGAEVEVLPHCGHSPLVEMPARTAELIRAFAEPQAVANSSRCSSANP